MSTRIPQRHGKFWTRDELILAFELYCRIPFRKTNTRNPQVQELATLLQRSPASIARKLGNFGSFDPNLRRQNISGLSHAGNSDREVWDEFHSDWNRLVFEAHKLKRSIGQQRSCPMETTFPTGPTERMRSVKQRVHQSFFRQAVLSSYNNTCCITGLMVSDRIR